MSTSSCDGRSPSVPSLPKNKSLVVTEPHSPEELSRMKKNILQQQQNIKNIFIQNNTIEDVPQFIKDIDKLMEIKKKETFKRSQNKDNKIFDIKFFKRQLGLRQTKDKKSLAQQHFENMNEKMKQIDNN
jgi:hypothetical protein